MSTIQFGGVISGLNTQGIVDALVAVKKQPLTDLQSKEASLTAQKTAYTQLGAALDATDAAVSQYQISVDRLATATRATSTGAIGAPVTDTSKTLQTLNLPGSVTAGTISAIVDGTIVHYSVGDPATITLDQFMSGLGQAIQDQLEKSDPAAGVTVSVVNNRLELTLTGATLPHSLSFGSAGDTSNALGILGLADSAATIAVGDPPLSATTNLGVARMTGSLDNAGLNGLASTTAGTLSINGVGVAYDTTVDSLSTIISRINNSSAGVIASIDRTNDRLILTRKDTGALAMDIEDSSGNLGAALGLAPGTTNAQTIGLTAKVTVDGRSVTSVSCPSASTRAR